MYVYQKYIMSAFTLYIFTVLITNYYFQLILKYIIRFSGIVNLAPCLHPEKHLKKKQSISDNLVSRVATSYFGK